MGNTTTGSSSLSDGQPFGRPRQAPFQQYNPNLLGGGIMPVGKQNGPNPRLRVSQVASYSFVWFLSPGQIIAAPTCVDATFSIMRNTVVPDIGTMSNLPVGVIADLC